MAGPAVLIRESHRLRRFIRELQEQIERAPRVLKPQQAKVAHQETLLREAQETLKKVKISIHEKEVTFKATHTQLNKHNQQLQTSSGKKEYDALQLELKHEREQIAALEEEILNAMGETEERTAQLPELEANVKKAKQDFATWEAGAQGSPRVLADAIQGSTGSIERGRGTVAEGHPAAISARHQRDGTGSDVGGRQP